MSADPNLPKSPVAAHALKNHDALPAGTRFGEFEIISVLGVGGFGIVYLAQDHSLERQVALKEYMPAALAARGAGPMIAIRAGAFAETYAAGLRSFINEARLLARFDHPSLVKVYRFWEDNGTAYMVMPYLQGRTLRDARRAMGHAPDEAWIRGVLEPLLDALELLHREGVFHRDIAPDNVLLPPGALPILLDFGAARRVINGRTQSLTAIVKPSYAPIEQYAEMSAMRQGPWTDLYALGAVLHYLLFGAPPAPATARAVQPELEFSAPIDQRVVPGVSPRFIGIVAWMLGVRPQDRPQSVAALRVALHGQSSIPANPGYAVTMPSAVIESDSAATATLISPRTLPQSRLHPVHPTRAPEPARPGSAPMRSTPPGTLPPAYVPAARVTPAPTSAAHLAASAPEPAPARGRGPMLAGGALAAAVAIGVLWQFVGVVGGPRSLAPRTAAASVVGVHGAGATDAARAPGARAVPVLPAASGATPAATKALPVLPAAPAATPVALAPLSEAGGVQPVQATASVASPVDADVPRRKRPPAVRTLHPRAAVERGPANARAACGDRSFFSMAVCLDRECERPRFRHGAECVKVLEVKRRRTDR